MDAVAIIEAYEALLKRAEAAVRKVPTEWGGQGYEVPKCLPDWASVTIEGETAALHWFEDGYRDSGSYLTNAEFPTAVLDMTDVEFAAWCEDQDVRRRQLSEAHKVKMRLESEEKERAALAALKAKYER